MKRKGELSLVTWIKRRIKRNLNCIAVTQGQTGSGKSLSQIALALQIDPLFIVEKQVVFKLKPLMRLLRDPWFLKKEYKIIIYEEFQTSAGNRQWQSLMNKVINRLLSTFRHQNVILLINAPYKDFLDSQSMKLVHIIMSMKGINRKKKTSKMVIRIQDYNPSMKKTYEHSLYVIDDEGVSQTDTYHMGKPPEDICERYEVLKSQFTKDLNAEIERDLDKMEKQEEDPMDEEPLHLLDGDEAKLYQYIVDGEPKTQQEIAKETGIDFRKVSRLINKMEKKKISIRKYLGKPTFSSIPKDSLAKT